jgi:hypothetical protein
MQGGDQPVTTQQWALSKNIGISAIAAIMFQAAYIIWWARGMEARTLEAERAGAITAAAVTALQVADRDLHKLREESAYKMLVLEQRTLYNTNAVTEIKAAIDGMARELRDILTSVQMRRLQVDPMSRYEVPRHTTPFPAPPLTMPPPLPPPPALPDPPPPQPPRKP